MFEHFLEPSDKIPTDFLQKQLGKLCQYNVFLGTSSWKFQGWCGLVYNEQHYITRGKFSLSKFQEKCLIEYAQIFRTVCVDAGFYRFPTPRYLSKLADQVPEDFRFGFKVTDEITVKHFPKLSRHGHHSEKINKNFLNADFFITQFLNPCMTIRSKVGPIIFEFSRFNQNDYLRGRDFIRDLDRFLARLPKGWAYGVEVRNSSFLHADYFAVLRRHGVAHVFNQWSGMPPVFEQLKNANCFTTDFVIARFLLRPGLRYQHAQKKYYPYHQRVIFDNEGLTAAQNLIQHAIKLQNASSFIYIGNKFEGSAPWSIWELVRKR